MIPNRLAQWRLDGLGTGNQIGTHADLVSGKLAVHYGVPSLLGDGTGDCVALASAAANVFDVSAGGFEVWAWGTHAFTTAGDWHIVAAGTPASPQNGRPGFGLWDHSSDGTVRAGMIYYSAAGSGKTPVTSAVNVTGFGSMRWRVEVSGSNVTVKFYRGSDAALTAGYTDGWHASNNATASQVLAALLASDCTYSWSGLLSNVVITQLLTDDEASSLRADPRLWMRNTISNKLRFGALLNTGAGAAVVSQSVAANGTRTNINGTIAGATWNFGANLGNRWTNADGAGDQYAGGRMWLPVSERVVVPAAQLGAITNGDFTIAFDVDDATGWATNVVRLMSIGATDETPVVKLDYAADGYQLDFSGGAPINWDAVDPPTGRSTIAVTRLAGKMRIIIASGSGVTASDEVAAGTLDLTGYEYLVLGGTLIDSLAPRLFGTWSTRDLWARSAGSTPSQVLAWHRTLSGGSSTAINMLLLSSS